MTTEYEDGSDDAPICLLGEAPSFVEMKEHKPFVGPAGEILERCMHSAGIPRRNCRILNVFETPIVKPKISKGKIFNRDGELLWAPGKGFTEAGHAATASSLMRLRRTTSNVIVPMGGVALTLALEARSITKWRGSIIPGGEQINHRKIVPTIHPSAVLQGKYEYRYLIINDLKRAKRESAYPDIRPIKRNLIIDPTYEQCISFLEKCLDAKLVNTDIELLHGHMDCFSLAIDPLEAISIPIVDATFESRWSPEEELKIFQLYAQIIGAPHIAKVNQNITFDLATLLQLYRIVPRGVVHDPMVAHSIMYTTLDKSLGLICSMHAEEPYYKDDGQLHDSPTVADFTRRWEYNAKDSAISLESWLALEPSIDPEGYRATYDMTINVVSSLIYMMAHGIPVNAKALIATREEANAQLIAIVERLRKSFNRPILTEAPKRAADKRAAIAANAININSPAQLCAYFYGEKGLRPYKNMAGAPTVDDKALTRIASRFSLEEARTLQEYRKIDKIISTYLNVRYDVDGKLRSSFNIRGAWTGRLSSSQTVFETGLNFQNLPIVFRQFMEGEGVEAHPHLEEIMKIPESQLEWNPEP